MTRPMMRLFAQPLIRSFRGGNGAGGGEGRDGGAARRARAVASAATPGTSAARPTRNDEEARWTDHRAQCPVCLGELAAVPDEEMAAHRFRHAAADDEARCSLTTPLYQPQEMTVRHMRDAGRERLQRGAFVRNWLRHYCVMRQLAPSLTVRRLALLIDCADVANLWSYEALAQRDLPYVLLVLAGFIRHQGAQGEPLWLRFCFDGSVHDAADLWRGDRMPPGLFRMVYRQPAGTPFPTSRELMYFRKVGRNWRFLDGPAPRILRSDARQFQRMLGAEDPSVITRAASELFDVSAT